MRFAFLPEVDQGFVRLSDYRGSSNFRESLPLENRPVLRAWCFRKFSYSTFSERPGLVGDRLRGASASKDLGRPRSRQTGTGESLSVKLGEACPNSQGPGSIKNYSTYASGTRHSDKKRRF